MRSTLMFGLKSSLVTSVTLTTLVACSSGNNPFAGAASSGSSRLNVLNRPLSIDNGQSGSSVSAMAAGTPTLTLVASVLPPSVNGQPLQANAATFSGNNIYVAYNLAGGAAGGGVDEIDVTIPASPVLNSSHQFPTLDVNAVHMVGTTLYVAGNDSVADQPARVQKWSTTLLGAVNQLLLDVPQIGYAAVALAHNLTGTLLYGATGDNSGVDILDPATLASTKHVSLLDARDVSVALTGSVYAVTGNGTGMNGQVAAYDAALNPTGSINIGDTGLAQSKSTLQTGAIYGLATAGSGGAKMLCLGGLQVTGTAPAPAGGVTNAAVFVGGFMFTADGANGVGVYSVTVGSALVSYLSCSNLTLTKLGTINFGTSVSANYIAQYGSYLVVGGGLGGFQLIRLTLPGTVLGLLSSL